MHLWKEVILLIRKDVLLEWRTKYALGGIFLYVIATVFVVYLSLNRQGALGELTANIWIVLFWITILFTAVNAVAKSFTQESRGRTLYYYTLASPQAIIISKLVYNALLMIVLSLICAMTFTLMVPIGFVSFGNFLLLILLGAPGFSLVLTMMSAIASKTENGAVLMAILSFPIILPLILLLMNLSDAAFVTEAMETFWLNLVALLALDVLTVVLSLILFPYLWRD